MKEKFCQCCGMPMGQDDALYGLEKNGEKSQDYCKYCYENGEFTFHGTMEEMIEFCITPMVNANQNMTNEQAREMMKQYFPTLKRWNTTNKRD